MEEIVVAIPEQMAEEIREMSTEWNTSVEEIINRLLRMGFEQAEAQRVIDPSRGQRPEARSDPRLDWWRDAKFGLFIHWGLYAIPAGVWKGQESPGIGEWIMQRTEIPVAEYEQLASQFNPVQFDAEAWVAVAEQAGMKYVVITSKHHDGFCLFHSEETDYSVVDGTPFGRDVIKELANACEKRNMPLGFYYSQTQDWHHPDGDGNNWDYDPAKQDFDSYFDNYVQPQVRELLSNYGPVALIWFDTPKGISQEQSQSLLDLVHSIQPDCLVSGRLGNGLGDYASAGDNRIPGDLAEMDWETPATMNDTWGFKVNDHNWKSSEDLIRKLVDIVSKGGNYLLNVGPTAEGVIPQPSIERLAEMGRWMDVNGESLNGARPGPIQGVKSFRTTQKEGTVYVHIFHWPGDGVLRVDGLTIRSAKLLADNTQLSFMQDDDSIVITLPESAPDPAVTVVELALE